MAKLFIMTLLSLTATVWSYSGGAPEAACDDMTPKHLVGPQDSPLPYKVSTDKNEVKPGEEVKISIGGKPFKGFLLQVRDGDKATGTFDIAGDDRYFKSTNCHGIKGSSATHKNSVDKKDITLTWKAPEASGKYTIYATVAENGGTFWAAHPSGTIKVA